MTGPFDEIAGVRRGAPDEALGGDLDPKPRRANPSANALSVDVEDWFHDESRPIGPVTADELGGLEARVEPNLRRLLAMFEANRTRVTFFFLGDVVARAPELVRLAADAGHEIACHG